MMVGMIRRGKTSKTNRDSNQAVGLRKGFSASLILDKQ